MGRNRKRNSEKVDGCLVALVVPVAVVCAFPILLVPIVIGVVLWISADIIKMVEQHKLNKAEKKFQEENSRRNVLKRNNTHSSIKWNLEPSPNNDKLKIEPIISNNKSEVKDNTFSFNEILSICDDIENKLLEVEMSYAEVEEDNDELDSLYFELQEYEETIESFRNIKLIDLNDDLLEIVRNSYNHFLELYDDFNLLTCDDAFKQVKAGDRISISDAMALGAVGYSIFKNRKKAREEKEREEYREELRNTWGLSEYEIDLVESGEYEPSQFSEEELEEDDYYGEDNYE